ncbi:hypothetical protein AB3N02_22125 [Priestia aryabhattai]|uniref:hypothetical protein n=1 Tax=Priestia aryabhattai TaxID=412384 RepID=UPI0039A12ECD
MNEILTRKHIKEVMKYGISKEMAKEIVETAYETGKGKSIEKYIDYAIGLVYGLKVRSNAR